MDDVLRQSSGVENSSLLFEKPIPVRIKSLSEDRDAELTIRIILGLSKLRRSSKVLQVQITNELDPFFLYFLEVSEEDFQSLKVEQCILVDFGTFPHKFIELLEHCIRAGTVEAPRFLAVLNVRTGDSTFSVVETNQFKHLSHLSLCFRQGNDSTIKSYLAGRLAEYKGSNGDLHEKLRRTIESLECSIQEVDALRSELADLKEMHARSMSDVMAKNTVELAHEREKARNECAELRRRVETERAEMESQLRERAGIQENHVIQLEKQISELSALKKNSEMTIRELNTRIEAASKDLQDKEKDYSLLDSRNRSLTEEFQKASQNLHESVIKLAAMEQEVQSKNELVLNMSRQLETQASHRLVLESSLRDAQAAAERAEEKADACLAEANSCKQTIEKLQGELKSSKAKVKLKAQVVAQQDTLLHERQVAVEKGAAENSALRQELAALKEDRDCFRKKADELQKKYDESQESNKSHQQMVQWLNQQLTDSQLGKYSISSRYKTSTATSFDPNRTLPLTSLTSSSLSKNILLPGNSSTSSSSISAKSIYCPSKVSFKGALATQPGIEQQQQQAQARVVTTSKQSDHHGNNGSSSSSSNINNNNSSSSNNNNNSSSRERNAFTVEWKRSGMPNPQLSFSAPASETGPEEFPVPKASFSRGIAEEISGGGRFPSRASSMLST